ncbi:hypothetical protein EAH79_16200 [Sphingomonas koreensis]|nr:hypothetical protein EAH79_16200 [Sphingomonas koreensis]
MSRRSLSSRLDRIRDVFLPPGSWEWRVDRLDAEMKEQWLLFSERVGDLISRAQKQGPGEAYRQMIDGELDLPPMPSRLAEALDIKDHATLPIDCTIDEASRRYGEMLDPGSDDV